MEGQTADELKHTREEQRVRRFGTVCLTAGILLIPLTFIAFMGVELATTSKADTTGTVFAILGVLTLALLGTALIILGGMERLHRPVRKRQRNTAKVAELARAEHADAMERLLAVLADDREGMNDKFDMWLKLAAPVAGRLVEIEKRLTGIEASIADLPAYGQGVIDGAQMRRSVLGSDVE